MPSSNIVHRANLTDDGGDFYLSSSGYLKLNTFHAGSAHQPQILDTTLLSPTFAIDSIGVKTVTIPHNLGYTPLVKEVQLTVAEDTAVDDWGFVLLKIVSVDGTNVIAKINVTVASLTVGATAKLAVLVVGITDSVEASRSMGWYQQYPIPKVLRRPQPRYLNSPYTIIGGVPGIPIPLLSWFEQPSDPVHRKGIIRHEGISVIAPSQLP